MQLAVRLRSAYLRGLAARCVEQLGFPRSEDLTPDTVVVVDAENLEDLAWQGMPLVVVHAENEGLPRSVLRAVGEGRAVGIPESALEPNQLAVAVVQVAAGALRTEVDVALERTFGQLLPRRLVRAFLREPGRFTRLSDLVTVARSRTRARRLVTELGLTRAEYLFTRMRCCVSISGSISGIIVDRSI